MTFFRHIFLGTFVALCVTVSAFAQAPAPAEQAAAAAAAAEKQAPAVEEKMSPEQEAMMKTFIHGPAEAKLRDVAGISVPQGMMFIPAEQASIILQKMGNHGGESVLGMIVPESEDAGWFVVADYDDSGFIKDAEGDNFNADEILKAMQDGMEEDNQDRIKEGHPAMEIVGWVQKPTYNKESRQLVWSVAARDIAAQGASAQDPNQNSVNYNTFTLGRAGYISLNLVSSQGQIEKDKQVATTLLSGLKFVQGRRYEDFDSKTDKVAEYGLMALIGGVALKKLGLFAGLAVLAAKFAKVIVIVVLGAAVSVKKFFSRKNPSA